MDGIAVLERIKSIDRQALVVVMTGERNTDLAIRAMARGASDYLVKPFDPVRAASIVREILAAAYARPAEVSAQPAPGESGLIGRSQLAAGNQLSPVGGPLTPFPGCTGPVRSVVADFNGDGIPDAAYGTGAGTSARVRIINGATGTELVGPTAVLDGFGGVFLTAGDADSPSTKTCGAECS